jgi:IclR family acetate operon transcriptional repressor
VRQLDRVLDILEQLAREGQASLADLTDAVDAPRASVHRLLVALESRGYVHHLTGEARYELGPAIQRLAARNTESALMRISAPALADLRSQTGETVNLAVLDGSRIVYAATVDGTLLPRMSATVGTEVEPHATALGKAILSVADAATRDRILPAAPYPTYTTHTIATKSALTSDLDVSAHRGFAVEIEESVLSATCIAVPIRDTHARPIAAISISSISARLPVGAHTEIAKLIRDWTTRIERDLNGAGGSV